MNHENKVSVINGGVAGYNVFQEGIFIDRYLRSVFPDLVILALYVNDITPVFVPALGIKLFLDYHFTLGRNGTEMKMQPG